MEKEGNKAFVTENDQNIAVAGRQSSITFVLKLAIFK